MVDCLMRIYSALVMLLLLPLSIFGQSSLTREQVLKDYSIFKEVLTTAHPSLYEYTKRSVWDSLFLSFEEEVSKDVTTPTDLFKSLSAMAAYAKDGHLNLLHPKMDVLPNMFPVQVKLIGSRFYTDTDDFGIPVGSEIHSIEGISTETILTHLLKYAPSDGFNQSMKHRQIEKDFGILHFYEFGARERYIVEYTRPSGETETIEIAAQSFESIGRLYPNRSSHFASYHQATSKTGHFKNRIAPKWPFVYFIDSSHTAVLTVNSFGLDPKEFKSRLVDLFKEIRKKKTKNLVIDIRRNQGGYRINAIHLYSFLAEESFRQRVLESAVTDRLPHQEYVLHTMSDYDEFFEQYFAGTTEKDGRWTLTEDHAQAEMQPCKKTFKGNTYVLIGGTTFSAASAFALNAKHSEHITLVGEETGGGYYFHTAQFVALYELPCSKVMVRVPFVKVDKYVLDTTVPKGSGVPPDKVVPLTRKDLVLGMDSQLDYVLKGVDVR